MRITLEKSAKKCYNASVKRVIKIEKNLIGTGIAFLIGVGIASLNYAVARFVLKKYPAQYASTPVIRQIIQVGYLVALYALGGLTPWDRIWLMVGGALGITLPMPFFTYRLVKLNQEISEKGKEECSNG